MSLGQDLAHRLRHRAINAYLGATAELTNRRLRQRPAARNFERVAIVAPLAKANGIAAGARLQFEWLRREGVDVELLDATASLRNPFASARHRAATAYVFHCGGPQTASLIASVLPEAASSWRVAYWAWELPDPDESWRGCDRPVDEIWTPSAFSAESLGRMTGCPVHVVPHRLATRPARIRHRGRPFTVLAMADSRSSFARKNPLGAWRAFEAAFGDRHDRRLILKLSGRPDEIDELELMLAGAAINVSIRRELLDASALDRLFDETDVLLSLHRAEGFGLPMLEAMARGIPVIATGWSGNLQFMDEDNSVLVPCRTVPVEDPSGIYRASVWAEPDIDAAAVALRALADDPAAHARLAAAAHRAASGLANGPFPPPWAARQ